MRGYPIRYMAILLSIAACACGEADLKKAGPQPPVVTDDRDDLLLSWLEDGGPQVGSTVAEVPAHARREVRVQDPGVPPEDRDPGIIFLADLRKPGPLNRYPVKVENRAAYEARQRKIRAEAKPAKMEPAGLAPGQKLIMYSTKGCPVCLEARRWLVDKQIPFIEKDIEVDRAAAQALARKGIAQGVPVKGVPVFDIGGKLVPGFDRETILRAIRPRAPQGPGRVI
jgi:glutaredoxin 3